MEVELDEKEVNYLFRLVVGRYFHLNNDSKKNNDAVILQVLEEEQPVLLSLYDKLEILNKLVNE